MALTNAIKYALALRNPSATQIVPSNLSFLKKITVLKSVMYSVLLLYENPDDDFGMGWDGGDMMCLSVDQSDPVSWYRSHIEYISKLTNKFVLRTYFG